MYSLNSFNEMTVHVGISGAYFQDIIIKLKVDPAPEPSYTHEAGSDGCELRLALHAESIENKGQK